MFPTKLSYFNVASSFPFWISDTKPKNGNQKALSGRLDTLKVPDQPVVGILFLLYTPKLEFIGNIDDMVFAEYTHLLFSYFFLKNAIK